MTKGELRAVEDDERPTSPKSLEDAIESGDLLEILLAQRKLVGKALVTASDNTRSQHNNDLNKLHVLIAEEQARRAAENPRGQSASRGVRRSFDAAAL